MGLVGTIYNLLEMPSNTGNRHTGTTRESNSIQITMEYPAGNPLQIVL